MALAKTFLQKLYKMYTKVIQNTISVYVWYTEIVQIKILYDNECTKNVTYKKISSTKYRLKMTWNSKCMHFVHTNNVQTIQNL